MTSGVSIEWILEGAVILVVAVLVGRVFFRRPIRRELVAHPLIAGALLFAGMVGLAALFWICVSSDLGRRLVVSGVGLIMLLAVLRARPGHGRSRGLPPGSLGLTTSLDAIDDPDFYAKAEARWGPIFKMSQIHRPVVCLTDLESSLEFVRANDDALSQSGWSFNRLVPGGYLEYMNGDAHTRYRTTFGAAYTRQAVDESRETTAVIARQQLAAMARAAGQDGIHPEHYLLPIAQTSLLRMVLGVEPGHMDFDALCSHFTDLSRPMELMLPAPQASQDTFQWLCSEVAQLARDLRVGAASLEVPRSVLADLVKADAAVTDDPTVTGNLVLMVKEGSIMVRGLLRWIVRMLALSPEWVDQIREAQSNPSRLDALLSSFVNETIRLYESRYVYRNVERDVRLGPYRIPKGWLLRLCLGEAHENADHFREPKRFNPDRFVEDPPDRTTFCPFGDGRHACLGADVAIEIAKTFAREAALGYQLKTLADGRAWRINRHWGLWRPSLQLRIEVSPRTV